MRQAFKGGLDPSEKAESKKGGSPETNETQKIESHTMDKIMAVLSFYFPISGTDEKVIKVREGDADKLIDVLRRETGFIRNSALMQQNGYFMIVRDLLSKMPDPIKETFIHAFIKRAPEIPFFTITLLQQMNYFTMPGIHDLPTVREAVRIIDREHEILNDEKTAAYRRRDNPLFKQ